MSSSDPESKSHAAKEHQQLHPTAIMPMQPQQQPHPAAGTSMGGIGRAFLRPSSPQHPQPPPPINNHFQSRNNTNNSINVDNIFASRTQGNNNAHRSNMNNMNNNSNNIFHNFATMNDAAIASSNGPISFRKYSDSTNYHSRSRSKSIASTANSNTATATAASNTNNVKTDSDVNVFTRSGSDGDGLLSKSVGTASFLKQRNRNMSESESNPSTTIRHAGYLLKRSNLPYITSSSSSANNTMTAMVVVDDTIGGIVPLPDLSRVDDDIINGVFNLPFGGLDESVIGGDNTGLSSDSLTLEGMLDNASSNSLVSLPSKDKHFQPIIEPTPTTMTSVTTKDTADEYVASTVDDEPCFCSPIIQYFENLFHIQRQSDALVAAKTTGINLTSHSTNLNSPPSRRMHSSPTPTRPLPISPTKMSPAVYGYSMPLKSPARSPARSDPVPISPGGGHNKSNNTMNTASMSRRGDSSNSLSHLSRSLSNGVIITKKMTAPNKKEYPPPPSDYIDPKDGHIWRAKYCVLEEGILYFYRTAEEGESDEAQAERCESRMYSEDQEDIVLGEYTSSSPTGRGMSSLGGRMSRGRSMLGAENRTSSRDGLYDLSKSPMPWKKSGFDFSKSPFHRSGSSVLTGVGGGSRGGSGGSVLGDDGSRSTATPIMHHSNSTSTFHQDAEILWEKRVALDCVGAVRSSEQEHGYNAFELLAYGSDDRTGDNEQSDASTRDSSVGGGQYQKQEIIDRLILRAGSSDDMNTWMFQFYRSLTSFMEQIVNSVRSGDRDSARRADLLGIIRPDSPGLRRLHGASAGKGSLLSPFVTSKQSFASSPTNSFGGGNFVGSLSHGHGRNALYRRQVRDNKSNDASVISPLPTPAGTPAGGSSPVDIGAPAPDGSSLLKKKQPSLMPSTIMVDLSLRGEGKDAEAAPAPKKYIPPHMRSAAPKKYIPPHMRSKLAAASGGNSAADTVAKKCTEKHVPLNDEEQKDETSDTVGGASEVLDETLSDQALSATSTSSLLSRQLEDAEDIISASINVRLGGCADPTVIVGSIIDHHFIHRKASVVGNVRLEAYGGLGGGFLSSFGRRQSMSLLDGDSDLDTMMGSTRRSSDSNNSPHIRSVLKWEVGASSECGVRNSNEDSYVVINNLDELISSQGLVSFSQQDLGQTRQQGLYAIFDGHVGNQAARFSAEKFHEILIEEQSSLASQDSACLSSIEERADFILRKAFDRLDRDFCSLCTKDGRDWDCGSTALVALIIDDVVSLANLGDCSGFVCRLVSGTSGSGDMETDDGWEELDPPDHGDDPIWDRANGGGDTAYTSRGKLFWKEVTETHSALFDDERTRIEKANGWIIKETEIPIGQLHRMDIFDEDVVEIVKRCFADRMKSHRSDPVRQIQIARTCGDLAVSRAIGDRDFKAAYNMPSSNNTTGRTADLARSWEGPPVFLYPEGHSGRFKGDLVSSIPDIKSFRVGQEGVVDEFLLMACDGLWDVMDGDDAVRIAKNLLFDKKLSAKDGAARLAELAQHLGSSDNITVVLIRFYWEEEEEECKE